MGDKGHGPGARRGGEAERAPCWGCGHNAAAAASAPRSNPSAWRAWVHALDARVSPFAAARAGWLGPGKETPGVGCEGLSPGRPWQSRLLRSLQPAQSV